jgi:hypothetical protein
MPPVRGTSARYWRKRLDDDACLWGVIAKSLHARIVARGCTSHSLGAAPWLGNPIFSSHRHPPSPQMRDGGASHPPATPGSTLPPSSLALNARRRETSSHRRTPLPCSKHEKRRLHCSDVATPHPLSLAPLPRRRRSCSDTMMWQHRNTLSLAVNARRRGVPCSDASSHVAMMTEWVMCCLSHLARWHLSQGKQCSISSLRYRALLSVLGCTMLPIRKYGCLPLLRTAWDTCSDMTPSLSCPFCAHPPLMYLAVYI